MGPFQWRMLTLAMFLSCSVFAASSQDQMKQEFPCPELVSKIQIGGNYTYCFIKPNGEKQAHGSLGGAQAMYEFRPANRFYGGGRFSWRQGDTQSSEEKISLAYIDAHERLGYTFSWKDKKYLFSLFSGFGYRYLRQHVRPHGQDDVTFNSSFFPPFLTESTDVKLAYYEFYVPVGFLADFAINCFFSLGLYATWMPQIFPTVNINPLGNAFWSLTKRWKNVLVELPFTFTLTKNKRCMLIVKPTYEFWQDGHSKAKTSTGIPLGLPGNNYQFIGGDVNFCYAF